MPADMGAVGDTNIAQRLMDYFQRQSAWLESVQEELKEMPDSLQSDDLDEVIGTTLQWDTRNKALAEEFVVLKKEWDRTEDIPSSDRKAIQALARDVESKVETVRILFEQSAALAGEKSLAMKESLDELKQGRGVLGKYKAPSSPDSSYFDSSM
ncbi:MAG: hypothetical protein COA73_10515 [Candidatus Hydrogenedentota bacterium]|nr:MAG: hypothetical protein COA73_10515 [Candidatus Hydrogenedentota bacterium]